jgi:transcriptional regulator with XRE-family HTH domain
MAGFGVLFGRLVRQKRGIERLSQDGLAQTSEVPKARISAIETGKIGSPHPRTVDALCVALNISPAELSACYTAPAPGPAPRAREELFRNIRHVIPGITEKQLERYLDVTEEELQEYLTRIAEEIRERR